MSAAELSSKYVTPISPLCPTCGKEMRQTSVTPTCKNTIYDYVCSNDGDRLSWQPGHPNKSSITRHGGQKNPTTI